MSKKETTPKSANVQIGTTKENMDMSNKHHKGGKKTTWNVLAIMWTCHRRSHVKSWYVSSFAPCMINRKVP